MIYVQGWFNPMVERIKQISNSRHPRHPTTSWSGVFGWVSSRGTTTSLDSIYFLPGTFARCFCVLENHLPPHTLSLTTEKAPKMHPGAWWRVFYWGWQSRYHLCCLVQWDGLNVLRHKQITQKMCWSVEFGMKGQIYVLFLLLLEVPNGEKAIWIGKLWTYPEVVWFNDLVPELPFR